MSPKQDAALDKPTNILAFSVSSNFFLVLHEKIFYSQLSNQLTGMVDIL